MYVNTPIIDSSHQQLLYCIFGWLYFDTFHHPGNSVHMSLTVQTSQSVCVNVGVIISRQLKVGTVKQTCAYSSTYLSTCVKTCVYWQSRLVAPLWITFDCFLIQLTPETTHLIRGMLTLPYIIFIPPPIRVWNSCQAFLKGDLS